MNNVKVFVLMAGLTALLVSIGGAVGGEQGAMLALVFAAVSNFMAYFGSAKMVLRAYRAQVVSPEQAPELYGMVDQLRQRAGLPMPTVAVAPHRQPNAFATGRNPSNAVVCVTQGILEILSREELGGVLAHELGHVKNRDMLLQTVTATLAGAVSNLGRFAMYTGPRAAAADDERGRIGGPFMVLLAPMAAMMIQFAISRQREFEADRMGAEISGRPLDLASALRKLEAGARRIPMAIPPAVAPLAQVNPLAAFGGGLARLFSTHPSTAERVARLESMAAHHKKEEAWV